MNQATDSDRFEIISDGRTVWVNAATGECLGRFGRLGIDVHHSVEEQMSGAGQCLDCTHTKPTKEDWTRFVQSMKSVYGAIVGPEHKPAWL